MNTQDVVVTRTVVKQNEIKPRRRKGTLTPEQLVAKYGATLNDWQDDFGGTECVHSHTKWR